MVNPLENRDHFVSKDDLIASVWGGRIVFDSTLTNRINAAPRAAGDSGDEQKLIRTIASDQVDALGLIRQMLSQEGCPIRGEIRMMTMGVDAKCEDLRRCLVRLERAIRQPDRSIGNDTLHLSIFCAL